MPLWKPPSGAKLVDVSCGTKHTVVVDTAGRIWTLGSNKHGSLGRDTNRASSSSPSLYRRVPEIVEGLPEGVMWQRVSAYGSKMFFLRVKSFFLHLRDRSLVDGLTLLLEELM